MKCPDRPVREFDQKRGAPRTLQERTEDRILRDAARLLTEQLKAQAERWGSWVLR